MDIKERLIKMLDYAKEQERIFVNSLTQEERAATGQPDNWAARDILAHTTAWKRVTVERLDAAARGETPRQLASDDEENAGFFAASQGKSWDTLLREADQAHEDLKTRVQSWDADALTDPNRFAWRNGNPMWGTIAGNGFSHPIAHYGEFYARHGHQAQATRLQEEAAGFSLSVDDSPEWQGATIYNLACYYALAGERQKALERLGEALRLRPDLMEWSLQDSDLDSLRGDPAYKALYPA